MAQQLDVEWFPSDASQKPVDIARATLDHAKRHFRDVLIVDTAGRLAIDTAMMEEIKALHAALNQVETLFVVDAMQGQDAVNTAQAFNEALPLTGVIRPSWTAIRAAARRCRCAMSPANRSNSSAWAKNSPAWNPSTRNGWPAILGMGDVLSLIEDVQKASIRTKRRR